MQAIGEAKAEIEARAAQGFAREQADYEAKGKAQEERTGKKPRGTLPAPLPPGPRAPDQINLTDPDSRILSTAGGFEQSYKAAVDTDTMLVVATRLSQAANDKQQITADGEDVGCLARGTERGKRALGRRRLLQ